MTGTFDYINSIDVKDKKECYECHKTKAII